MKTTIDLPEDLFRRTQAEAASRGQSLKTLVAEALRAYLDTPERGTAATGWRRVFGQAAREEVAAVDSVIADELERGDPAEWT